MKVGIRTELALQPKGRVNVARAAGNDGDWSREDLLDETDMDGINLRVEFDQTDERESLSDVEFVISSSFIKDNSDECAFYVRTEAHLSWIEVAQLYDYLGYLLRHAQQAI